jgi:hypothetical protein
LLCSTATGIATSCHAPTPVLATLTDNVSVAGAAVVDAVVVCVLTLAEGVVLREPQAASNRATTAAATEKAARPQCMLAILGVRRTDAVIGWQN